MQPKQRSGAIIVGPRTLLIQKKKAFGNPGIDASWEGMHYVSINFILVNNSLGTTRGQADNQWDGFVPDYA